MSTEIVTGDDVALSVTLKKDNATFAIDTGATVKAALVNDDKDQVLLSAVIQQSTAPGADWPNSVVVVQFTSDQTMAIARTGSAQLEIQVDDGGKRTWFLSVVIIKGSIA